MLLMTDAAWQYDKQNKGKNKNDIAVSKMLSFEYRKQGFKLSLIGSDQVVIAYNDLMQYFYTQGDSLGNSEESLKIIMSLLGKFLLQIRRSMGNDMTQLNHWQMLEWFMVDARKWH